MPLPRSDHYIDCLERLHQTLLAHPIARSYLSGADIRFDGSNLSEADSFDLPFATLSTLEMAHLLSIFNGSRVHAQAQNREGMDAAPPGTYYTIVNNKLIHGAHKNRSGIFVEDAGTAGLFIEGLHIDHFFLNERMTPPSLGTVSFALCAITAHRAGLQLIQLIAAGGRGYNARHIGFKFWPKLGFDADLIPGEIDGAAHLQGCRTVQDVIELDAAWWEANGSQRLMTFDLSAGSGRSWRKLLSYTYRKISPEVHDG